MMKVELLAACPSSEAIEKAQRAIRECIAEVFSDTGDFSACQGGAKEFLSALAGAFSRSDVIVVGASPLTYIEQKDMLMRALKLSPVPQRAVLSKAAAALSHYTLDEDEVAAHAAMPEDATLFLSDIGLFSGFAVKRGKQYLVYLPLDLDRTQSIIEGSLADYLRQLAERERRRRARKAAKAAQEQLGSEPQPERRNFSEEQTTQKAEAALGFLRSAGLHVAVARTQTSSLLTKVISSAFGLDEYISVIGDDEHHEAASFDTHAAVYARRAMLDAEADVGAMISNVFSSARDNRLFVFVTVADANIARVKRVYAEPTESPKRLVTAAVDILLDMICDYEEEREEVPDDVLFAIADVDVETTESINKKSNWLKVGICILIAILMCIGIALLAVKIRARGNNIDDPKPTEFYAPLNAEDVSLAMDRLTGFASCDGEYEDIACVVKAVMGDDFEWTGSLAPFSPLDRRRLITALADCGISARIDGDVLYYSLGNSNITVRYIPPAIAAAIIRDTATASETTTAVHTTASTTAKETTTAVEAVTTSASTVAQTTATTAKPTEKTTAPAKETTTKERTTERITTPTTANSNPSSNGVFTFTAYGYGHGVGMSQDGAVELARAGKSYMQILQNYYGSSLTLAKDPKAPTTSVHYEGKVYSMKAYLAKATSREMGDPSLSRTDPAKMLEAYKAQIVAIYSNAKRGNFYMDSGDHALADSFNYSGTLIEKAVDAVMGEYLVYDGKVAFLPYYCRSAGKTCSVETVWGGIEKYPYLDGGDISPETNEVKHTCTMTADEFRRCVAEYNKNCKPENVITLSGSPDTWIEIKSHDKAVTSDIGYVSKVRVGNQTIKGITFRSQLLGNRTLRSHCFTFTYAG